MLTEIEAKRVAASVNGLRPDWSAAQVMGVLADERIRLRRSFADMAVVMSAVAADPASRQPTRVFEHGPWWELLAPRIGSAPTYRAPAHDDCATCNQPAGACVGADHAYEPRRARTRSVALTPDERAALIAEARAASPPPHAVDEKPPPRDPHDVIQQHTTQEEA